MYNPQSSFKVLDQYWQFLVELKAHSVYLDLRLGDSERVTWWVNFVLTVASSSSIAAWAVWQRYPFIWATIIAGSQLLSTIKYMLPYEQRIKPLRTLMYIYEESILRLEESWYEISQGRLTEDEIAKILMKEKKDKLSMWKKHMDSLRLPFSANRHQEASVVANDYFRQNYQNPTTNEHNT